VLPDGVELGYFLYAECTLDRSDSTIGCALNVASPKPVMIVFLDARRSLAVRGVPHGQAYH
jgi:hypothetical protein